jgi:8-oxo-dGTP pyrophosphatase MutT (NUDIX family)
VSENPWQTLGTRTVYANAWLRLREDTVIRPDGRHGVYGVVEMRPSVGVVALNDVNEIALVSQWRYTLGRMSLEIPTGGSEASDHSMLGAAQRELREETGLSARSWHDLGSVDNSNGVTNDVSYMFLATGLAAGADAQDPAEQVALSWLPFGQAVDHVLNGAITESVSVAAVLKLEVLLRRDPLWPATPGRPA